MAPDSRLPTVPNLESFVKELYYDGRLYYDIKELSDRIGLADVDSRDEINDELLDRVGLPFTVIDPRYIGYQFPTYMFIETENNLEHGSSAELNHFDQPENALLLGTVLGKYDLVHRRVNKDRWTSAEFSKWAKERLSYFEEFETYSIFQVARWYGKDRIEPIKQQSDIRDITGIEQDLLYYLDKDPKFLADITSDSGLDDTDVPAALENYDATSISEAHENLKSDDILLGTCVTYDINNTPWKPVLMGLSLGESGERDGNTPRMDLSVNHDDVITELQEMNTEYINNFTMPFITSGVGQSWADILLELRVEGIHHMDSIAEDIRDIQYVKSTRTHMMTDIRFNNPPKRVESGKE